MGLDIYCRWGTRDKYGRIINGMSWEEQEAQYTGFSSCAETGYLRFSWPWLRMVREVSAILGITPPSKLLFPTWQGSNGEEFAVDSAELARLVEVRKAIVDWLGKDRQAESEKVGKQYKSEDEPYNPEIFEFYVESMQDTVKFIDFVEAHKDRDGLRIEFN